MSVFDTWIRTNLFYIRIEQMRIKKCCQIVVEAPALVMIFKKLNVTLIFWYYSDK